MFTGSELVAASGVDVVTMRVGSSGVTPRGSVRLPVRPGEALVARDGARVVFAGGLGLDLVDVSTFDAPRAVAHADVPDAARGVAIAGDRVYVAAGSVLAVYAIDASELRLVASVPEPEMVENVARWRDRLVLARYFDVAIVDEAMPDVVLARVVPNPGGIARGGFGIAIDGDVAFVGGHDLVAAIALCPAP